MLYRFKTLFLQVRSFLLILLTVSHVSASVPGGEGDVTLEFKIGQMLLVGYRGLEADDNHPAVRDIRELHLGGVILSDYDMVAGEYRRNIESPEQVIRLTGALQQASATPLLIAIDQEGGLVTRLKESNGFPPTVSHQRLGAEDDCATTFREAGTIAETLAAIGINLNLAPVVDLNINPENPIIAGKERSFSADPKTVTRHAAAFVQAHREYGVICSLKHFPGHGSAAADSHLGLVDVTDLWSHVELEPYRNLIKAGSVDAVMTAHVFNARLDPDYPATLSHATITGLLRGELNYDGVVISDDLHMKAIAEHYGFKTAVRCALEAGVDKQHISGKTRSSLNAGTLGVLQIRREGGSLISWSLILGNRRATEPYGR